jgi:hypothetical protein
MAGHILSDSDEDAHVNKPIRTCRNPAPTAKLVDTNNTAQPGLVSQRRVIDEFRAAQVARDNSSKGSPLPEEAPSSTVASVDPIPAERTLEKRHISDGENLDTNNSDGTDTVRNVRQHKKGSLLFRTEIAIFLQAMTK